MWWISLAWAADAELCVVRAQGMLAAATAMELRVDGQMVGTLRHGRSLCLAVPEGKHQVVLTEGALPSALGIATGGAGYVAEKVLSSPTRTSLYVEVGAGKRVVLDASYRDVSGNIQVDQRDAAWMANQELRASADPDRVLRALPSARPREKASLTAPVAVPAPRAPIDRSASLVAELYARAGRPPPVDPSDDIAGLRARLDRGESESALMDAAEIGGALVAEGVSLDSLLIAGGAP